MWTQIVYHELHYYMTRVDLGSGGPRYLYLLLHQAQGVWGTASPLLIESFMDLSVLVIAASSYFNLDIHVHHKNL
jgi:hypothetical protein